MNGSWWENWEYDLPDGRRVLIPKGFVFDGASIPRLLWFFLSPTGLLLIPGLIHDFGYRYDYIWVVGEDGRICKQDQAMGQDYWDEVFYSVGEQGKRHESDQLDGVAGSLCIWRISMGCKPSTGC